MTVAISTKAIDAARSTALEHDSRQSLAAVIARPEFVGLLVASEALDAVRVVAAVPLRFTVLVLHLATRRIRARTLVPKQRP